MAKGRSWTLRTSRLSLGLGLGALAVAFVGTTLARYEIVGKLAGFSTLLVGALLAVLGVLAGLLALGLIWKNRVKAMKPALAGLALCIGFIGFLASHVIAAGDAPAIHDATTDLADPPEFRHLQLREDNLAGVGSIENWRKIHAGAYPDLKPVRVEKPVAAALEDARRVATDLGWDIAAVDPQAGRLEATAYASYIRFKDDVVIRIVPSPDGAGSIVDVRSVSRVGVGDLGYNAKRIRSFLERMSGS